MSKGIVALGVLSLLFAGCRGGEVGDLPTELITYKFEATVAVNPTQPVPNRPLNLNLEVTSSSNRPVKTDIFLKVVSDAGETLYESKWPEVFFHENEVWNLTQGFLPPSDAARSSWHVQITVTDHATNEVLYDQSLARLNFGL